MKHIPVLRMRIDVLMILKHGCSFNKQESYQTGRILIFVITLRKFIPIHLYSTFSETEQVKVLEELQTACNFKHVTFAL